MQTRSIGLGGFKSRQETVSPPVLILIASAVLAVSCMTAESSGVMPLNDLTLMRFQDALGKTVLQQRDQVGKASAAQLASAGFRAALLDLGYDPDETVLYWMSPEFLEALKGATASEAQEKMVAVYGLMTMAFGDGGSASESEMILKTFSPEVQRVRHEREEAARRKSEAAAREAQVVADQRRREEREANQAALEAQWREQRKQAEAAAEVSFSHPVVKIAGYYLGMSESEFLNTLNQQAAVPQFEISQSDLERTLSLCSRKLRQLGLRIISSYEAKNTEYLPDNRTYSLPAPVDIQELFDKVILSFAGRHLYQMTLNCSPAAGAQSAKIFESVRGKYGATITPMWRDMALSSTAGNVEIDMSEIGLTIVSLDGLSAYVEFAESLKNGEGAGREAAVSSALDRL